MHYRSCLLDHVLYSEHYNFTRKHYNLFLYKFYLCICLLYILICMHNFHSAHIFRVYNNVEYVRYL